ncbi:Metallo-dependent phosphatase [Microthyrium microscopicum]|uniref:Metallo-dependent phosphatase n=1 Tax=Microthyrium microscopicum TaxID=703497 RepID=A0A6A6UCW8_9PEZI|nr:Metallo-dependent phosphatase [Microthyrium microscopicum]
MATTPRNIKIPGQRLAKWAATLLRHHPLHNLKPTTPPQAVTIVCISDSHNKQPKLSLGDVLIHAGDLTENGNFDEFQTQLNWLASQPHNHKILIAGNHDVVLDEAFLRKFPERRYGKTQSAADLDWKSVKYLQDTSTTLTIDLGGSSRKLTVFGSPYTPKYGNSAFQYPGEEDIWAHRIPYDVDILVTHGPPRLYLDATAIQNAGCVFLAKRIHKVRPRLVVFGHIHVAHGRQETVLDSARELHDDIVNRWGGYWTLAKLAAVILILKLQVLLLGLQKVQNRAQVTTFVNASIVGGSDNELKNEPTVVVI